ncbi:MAG TPA: complex I subunit 1 family protein [Euzebyales bacterium]
MDLVDFTITSAVVIAGFALWLLSTAVFIWGERRIVAKMQSRIGPNRLGPFGILQTIADGAKLFFKEDIRPAGIDPVVYFIAPASSAIIAMLTIAVIPFGGTFEIGPVLDLPLLDPIDIGVREVSLQIWDPEIGMLWILAMGSVAVYGVTLGGWASGSKYSLLGGVRSTAQMISYELAMGLGLAAVFVWNGTLQSSAIVEAQSRLLELGPISLPTWNILPQLPAFALFFISAVAEAERPPFDLPEGEGELVGGFNTEYSGAKFAMFFLAEFMGVITMSAITVTLFLGGPAGPLFGLDGTFAGALLGLLYFAMKVFAFMFVFVWLRGTLPRMKYDRLMDMGWKVLLPIGLVWVMATAGIVVAQETVERGTVLRGVGLAVAVLLGIVLLLPLFERRRGVEPADGDVEGDVAASDDTLGDLRRVIDERTPDRVSVES